MSEMADVRDADLRVQPVSHKELAARRSEVAFVIVTAVDVELLSLLERLAPLDVNGKVLHGYVDQESYYVGRLGLHVIAATKVSPGSVGRGSSALAIDAAIRVWSPRAIVLSGIAFGLRPKTQALGDVLISERVIQYESERVGAEVIPRGVNAESGSILLNRFKDLAPQWSRLSTRNRFHCGPILSGEKLLANAEFRGSLQARYPSAIGGEMEGAGLYAAASRALVEWIVVKGICDWGDETKNDGAHINAAAMAVDLMAYVLGRPYAFDALLSPAGLAIDEESVDVTIHIDVPFKDFDGRQQEAFLRMLRDACSLSGRILVVSKESGSTKLTIRVSYEDAAALFAARDASLLEGLGVIELLDPRQSMRSIDVGPASRKQDHLPRAANQSWVDSTEGVEALGSGGAAVPVSPGGQPMYARKTKKLQSTEQIYDQLLNARTADRVTLHLKDGRVVRGALIFNPFKGTGRLINLDQEVSVDFHVDDILILKLL